MSHTSNEGKKFAGFTRWTSPFASVSIFSAGTLRRMPCNVYLLGRIMRSRVERLNWSE